MKTFEGRTAEKEGSPDLADLIEENALLRSMLASSKALAFIQDPRGRFRLVTPAVATWIGLTSEAIEERSWPELQRRTEVMDALEGHRNEALLMRRSSSGKLPSDDGRCFEYRIEPVQDQNGDVQGTLTTLEDVTEREEVERLQVDTERLRTIVDSTSDAVFIKDTRGRYLFVNSAALRASGRPREEVLGKTDLEIVSDSQIARDLMAADRRIMHSGIGETVEENVQTPRGTRIFLSNKEPYRDGQGRIVGLIGISQDITDRKRMEEGLRAGEKWFRSLIERAPVAIATSRNGVTVFGNIRYLKMFGYQSIEEVRGRPFVEQIAPQDRERALSFALSFEEGRTTETSMELLGLRKDGSVFPFHTDITIIDLGDGPIVLGFFTDITERRRAEEEMVQARRRFESLFLASNEGIALHENVLNDEGEVVNYRILDVNPAYERITGISKNRAVGRLASEVYGTDEPPYLDIYAKVGETGEPVTLETYFEPMDRHFFISVSSPAKGQFNTIFIDVSERIRLERDLEDAKSRAELYVDLLTHDISNYNTAAMGYLQLAEMRLKTDEKDRKLIAGPLQVLGYSSELIANVRDLKRVEAGRDKAQPVDVCDILQEVREAYKDPPEREVTINLSSRGSCWVMASRLLRDAFSNIVSNAIKHSIGTVTVNILVDHLSRDGQDMVRVSIEDDGPGIPDERKERIFDRSLMGLTKPVSRGLGLYLVKRLVEDHKGSVWVEDRVPGDHTKGARFVVLLPAVPMG